MSAEDLPRALRILPSRLALRAGVAAGLALCSALILLGVPAPGFDGKFALIGYWSGLALGALAAIGCSVRLVLQLPVIEASELGIAVWLEGPYHRPFFAPWSRVRSITLTRVPADGAAARDAPGIELDCEGRRLAWPGRSLSGDPRRWVGLLTRMKAAYRASPN